MRKKIDSLDRIMALFGIKKTDQKKAFVHKFTTPKFTNPEMIAESLIEHPKHYTQGIECADYIESHSMDFFQGNAVKYLTRFKHKGTPLDDLKKSKWYIERLIKKYSEK